MSLTYDQIVGRDAGRLAGLSDGVFAFAMTLLILDIHVPDSGAVSGEPALWNALLALGPRVVTYLLSFMTLAIFWNGQQTQLRLLRQTDRYYTWIQLAFLAVVVAMPFSTSLLAEFITYRVALIEYWANIALLGAALGWGLWYARRARLLNPEALTAWGLARNRVVIAQSLYLFGALLCVLGTAWSIGFIVAIQLYYATGIRLPLLSRTVIGRS